MGAVRAFPQASVAAVAGYALGGGCELAMSCDFIVAADSATFGQPEIRLGILPGAGGTQRWARVAGRSRAAELVLTARTVDAWTARDYGMVARVVPAERVVAAGVALAVQVAAVRPHRHAPVEGGRARVGGAAAGRRTGPREWALLGTLLSTEDHFEGIDAFLEKRSARFTGR